MFFRVKNNSNKNNFQQFLKYSLPCFFGYFFLEFYISFHQIFKGYASDLLDHVQNISKIGNIYFPQLGFEYTVFIIAKITHICFEWVSILFLSLILGLQALITFFLLNKLANIEKMKCVFFTGVTLTCGAIYIPFFNHSLHHVQLRLVEYLLLHPHSWIVTQFISKFVEFFAHYALWGIGSPNIWHSPTLIIGKLIGFIILYLYFIYKDIRITIAISILLALSCLYKPSFATIFIPAVFIYELMSRKNNIINALTRMAIITLPTLILLSVMYLIISFIYKTPNGQQSHVIFAPLAVIHLYVRSAAGALIEALSFPFLILIVRFKEIKQNNPFLLFSWIMLVFGYLYWALLAQSGDYFFSAGNFGWGYDLGLSFVFLFSIVEYLKLANTPMDQRNKHFKLVLFVINIILALHFISGLGYELRVIFNLPLV